MKAKTVLVRYMDADEVRRCLRLHKRFDPSTGMAPWLRWLRKYERKPYSARVAMIEKGGKLLGWGLLYDDPEPKTANDLPGTWLHVYVRKTARRRGLGRVLVETLLRYEPNAFVSGWSIEARAFWISLGFTEIVSPNCQLRKPGSVVRPEKT